MQYDERLPLQQTIKQPVPPSTWKPPKPAKPLQPKYCFDCQNCKREMAKTVSTDPNGIGSHKHETEKLSTMKKITSKPKRVTKPMVRKSHGGKKSEHVSTTKPEERKISRTEQYESHLTNIAKDVPLETIIIPTFQLAQPVIKYSTKKRTRTANYQHTEASLSISQSASLLTNFDADNIKADKLKSEHIRWPHSVEEVYVEKEEPKIKCFSNSVVKVKRDQSRTNETKTEPLLTYKEDVVMRHFQSDITPPTIALHQNQWLAGIQLKPTSDFVHKSAGKANIPSTGKENGNVETKGKTTDVSEALINAVAKKHKNRTLADLRKVREKLKEKGFDKEVHESNWENKRELDEMRRVLLSARPKVQVSRYNLCFIYDSRIDSACMVNCHYCLSFTVLRAQGVCVSFSFFMNFCEQLSQTRPSQVLCNPYMRVANSHCNQIACQSLLFVKHCHARSDKPGGNHTKATRFSPRRWKNCVNISTDLGNKPNEVS